MPFFMGYYRSCVNDIVPYAEANNIGLLTNASSRWSTRTDRFNKLWDYDCPHIVDPGGYTVLNKHGKYPWTVEEYHEWLTETETEFTWASVMDYVCTEKFDDQFTADERMEMTFENTLKQFEMEPDYTLLPVLQGRDVDDYVAFYDRLVDHGIPVEYVGLGSIQGISNTDEVVTIEETIRQRCPKIERIHGFGVKATAFKKGSTFDTADSQAWSYAPTNGNVYRYEDGRMYEEELHDDSRARTFESFKNYYRYTSGLMEDAAVATTVQSTLSGHAGDE